MNAHAREDTQLVRSMARRLAARELVAFPTETVYGLGADATNETAVRKIFAAKGRPADHPLIVHVAKDAPLAAWVVNVPRAAQQLIAQFWPGPLTLILKKSARIPDVVSGGQDTVGLRCPSHPLAQALLREFAHIGSGIIAAPSANKFGRVSPTTAMHVRQEFGDHIPVLDGGACDVGIESTILDLSRGKPVLLRPGAITREQIAAVIGEMPLSKEHVANDTPRVSGSLAAHYAPRTRLQLVATGTLPLHVETANKAGQRIAVVSLSVSLDDDVHRTNVALWVQAPYDAAAYAHELYIWLHDLDRDDIDLILFEQPPQTLDWEGVNDRLRRAAFGSSVEDET